MAIIGISGYSGSGKDTVGKIIQLLISDGNMGVYKTPEDFIKGGDYIRENCSGWQIKKWAGKLKIVASLLTGIPVENFEDQEFKKTLLGSEWDTYGIIRKEGIRLVAVQPTPHKEDSVWLKSGENKQVHNQMTVRDFLQHLGTDGLRDGLHPNVWVNALMADYKPLMSISFGIMDLGASVSQMEKMSKLVPTEYPNWIITDTRFPNEAQAIKDAGGIVIRVDRPDVMAINAHPSETELDNWNFDYKIANVSDLVSLAHTVQVILEKENLLKSSHA